jgi:hypothetical protein
VTFDKNASFILSELNEQTGVRKNFEIVWCGTCAAFHFAHVHGKWFKVIERKQPCPEGCLRRRETEARK